MTARAEKIAQQLLDLYGYRPPVDVYRLATELGLEVIEQDLEAYISGAFVRHGSGGVIVVNQNHHINRRRFSVGHEIAHFALEHAGDQFVDAATVFFRDQRSAQGLSLQEIQANAFAAALLMPRQYVLEALAFQPIDAFDDIALRRLADHFGVSMQAMTIRLVKLGMITSWSEE